MGYTSQQLDSRKERDAINIRLRASPEWRSAVQSFGLNPDGPLKLTKDQRRSMAQRFGLPESDFHIDPAGNINDFHGWKGLPTAVKVAIIAGAAVGGWAALPGTMLGTGAGSTLGTLTGAGGVSTGVTGGVGIGETGAVTGLAGSGFGTGSTLGAPLVAKAGLTTLDKVNAGFKGLDYATNLMSSRSQGKADQRAQTWQQNAYADQVKLLAEQRVEDQKIAADKALKEEARWNAQQVEIKRKSDLEESRYAESEARKAPYRAGGMQTLARLNARTQPTITPYQSRFMGQG